VPVTVTVSTNGASLIKKRDPPADIRGELTLPVSAITKNAEPAGLPFSIGMAQRPKLPERSLPKSRCFPSGLQVGLSFAAIVFTTSVSLEPSDAIT
jgi:hypothetical protein